jgi:hypothetical protein
MPRSANVSPRLLLPLGHFYTLDDVSRAFDARYCWRKEIIMQHVRVAVYKFKTGMADEVARRAEAGMLPTFLSQPGFVAYGLVKTGTDGAISLSVWETQAQAEKAVQVAATWVKDNIAEMTESVQNHVGDLAFFSSKIPVGS